MIDPDKVDFRSFQMKGNFQNTEAHKNANWVPFVLIVLGGITLTVGLSLIRSSLDFNRKDEQY